MSTATIWRGCRWLRLAANAVALRAAGVTRLAVASGRGARGARRTVADQADGQSPEAVFPKAKLQVRLDAGFAGPELFELLKQSSQGRVRGVAGGKPGLCPSIGNVAHGSSDCGGTAPSARSTTLSPNRHAVLAPPYQSVRELSVSPGGVFQAGASSDVFDNSPGSWLRTPSSSRLEIHSPDSRRLFQRAATPR